MAIRCAEQICVQAAVLLDRADRAGADPQLHGLAEGIAQQRGALQIGQKAPTRLVMCVADIISGHNALAGDAATSRHNQTLNKNIIDDYRYIVQNYSSGDELYFFGFSRGAYTVRSLCDLINNCGILKRADAKLIQKAFNHYKNPALACAPEGETSKAFRKKRIF